MLLLLGAILGLCLMYDLEVLGGCYQKVQWRFFASVIPHNEVTLMFHCHLNSTFIEYEFALFHSPLNSDFIALFRC